jgi:hypothetical protein
MSDFDEATDALDSIQSSAAEPQDLPPAYTPSDNDGNTIHLDDDHSDANTL